MMRVIGLMSGTSADGIDAALMEIDGAPGNLTWRVVKHVHQPHADDLRAEIFACFRPETSSVDRLCALNFALGRAFAQAALTVIQAAGLTPEEIDLIGSHGQTLWHIPSGVQASTLQLGEPAVIAELTGITTISNFRTRDMAAGGQGAPLVSYVDTLLFAHPQKVRVLQNLGGIANFTYLPNAEGLGRGERPFAFDTGPANMLIDEITQRLTAGEQTYDRDGLLAAQGWVDTALVDEWLNREPYFAMRPPKTTGRELFGVQYADTLLQRAQAKGLGEHDIIATVTALTARSIAAALANFTPAWPDEIIVSGGGAFNPTLLNMLSEAAAPAKVMRIDELGIGSDEKEAAAFAVLAYETWHNRPGNLPEATGAPKQVVLGNITPGRSYTGGY
jgi:anhydro-N-acetylmuramic acid kinase